MDHQQKTEIDYALETLRFKEQECKKKAEQEQIRSEVWAAAARTIECAIVKDAEARTERRRQQERNILKSLEK